MDKPETPFLPPAVLQGLPADTEHLPPLPQVTEGPIARGAIDTDLLSSSLPWVPAAFTGGSFEALTASAHTGSWRI